MYTIYKGAVGKLITLEPHKDAKIEDWIVRKDLTFEDCLISPMVVTAKMKEAKNKSVAVNLASDGYALFGGESGSDRQARYVIAIPYSELTITVEQ